MPVVLNAPTIAGTGGRGVAGQGAVTLAGAPAVAGTGGHGVGGSAAVVLQAVQVVGTGQVTRVRMPAVPRPPGVRAVPR